MLLCKKSLGGVRKRLSKEDPTNYVTSSRAVAKREARESMLHLLRIGTTSSASICHAEASVHTAMFCIGGHAVESRKFTSRVRPGMVPIDALKIHQDPANQRDCNRKAHTIE